MLRESSTLKMKSCTYSNINGPGVYYAKPNENISEKYIPYDFTHMWSLKKLGK